VTRWHLLDPSGTVVATCEAESLFWATRRFAPLPTTRHCVVSAVSYGIGYKASTIGPRCVTCHVKEPPPGHKKCAPCQRASAKAKTMAERRRINADLMTDADALLKHKAAKSQSAKIGWNRFKREQPEQFELFREKMSERMKVARDKKRTRYLERLRQYYQRKAQERSA
jgi:hypothetical protein